MQMSAAITKDYNAGADAAMTGVMNAMGQDGNFAASRLPIKNRINALDVSSGPAGVTLCVTVGACAEELQGGDQAA